MIEWSLDGGEPGAAVRIVSLLRDFWDPSGRNAQARGWLERGLELWAPDDAAAEAQARMTLGLAAMHSGDLATARSASGRALELAEGSGDPALRSRALTQLANAALAEGSFDETAELAARAELLARKVGDRTLIAFALNCVAIAAAVHGDLVRAQPLFEETAEHLRAAGDRRNLALVIGNLGSLAIETGDYAAAEEWFATAIELSEQIGERGRMPSERADLAAALLLSGKLDRAADQLLAALADGAEIGDTAAVLAGLSAAAGLAAARGDDRSAGMLRGCAEATADDGGLPWSSSDELIEAQLLAAAAERLGEPGWNAARMRGRAMSVAERWSARWRYRGRSGALVRRRRQAPERADGVGRVHVHGGRDRRQDGLEVDPAVAFDVVRPVQRRVGRGAVPAVVVAWRRPGWCRSPARSSAGSATGRASAP